MVRSTRVYRTLLLDDGNVVLDVDHQRHPQGSDVDRVGILRDGLEFDLRVAAFTLSWQRASGLIVAGIARSCFQSELNELGGTWTYDDHDRREIFTRARARGAWCAGR